MPVISKTAIFGTAFDTIGVEACESLLKTFDKPFDQMVRYQRVVGRNADLTGHVDLAVLDAQGSIVNRIVFCDDGRRLLPPSSSVTGTRFSAAAVMINLPTRGLPVKTR